jgi:hypothetical protein
MFAKRALFQGMNRRRTAPSAAKAPYCNDNYPGRRLDIASPRAPRRGLVCGWRQAPATGRLECIWQLAPVDPAAAEEPGISWTTGWLRKPLSRYCRDGNGNKVGPLVRRRCGLGHR